MKTTATRRRVGLGLAVLSVGTLVSGCAGFAGGAADGKTVLTLATVNNPQMVDMQELASTFEAEHPDIRVNFVQMEENDLRAAVTADIATGAGQYDLVTVGSYEVPIWGQNGWLAPLDEYAEDSPEYDVDDLMPPVREALTVDDRLYAAPFYAESSFLMYNTELLAEAGITEVPEHPTWQQVADMARQVHDDDTVGICLRGKPGWGEMFAPLTPVVQTFGGNWYDEEWNATVDGEGFTAAVQFYTDLMKDAGQSDPVSYGFTECLNLFSQGEAAFWYDATSAAGSVESPELSQVAGKVGYAHAPVVETDEAGWLWAWNLAIPETSQKKDAAWTFIEWATSKEYVRLVGEELGWSRVPPGSRISTYEIPEYREEAAAFAPLTYDIMMSVDPAHPGVQPQPWVGIQYVTIPEFQDVGTQVSQEIAEVLAGRKTVEQALEAGQRIAQPAGEAQKEQ